MTLRKKENIGILALVLATLLWGITFSFIKDAVASLTPYNFIFWRFAIASVVLYIFFYRKIKFTRKTLEHGLLLGLFLAGIVFFQTIGLVYTTASTAAFITGFSVVLVALFETFFGKNWPSIYLILSAVLAVTGIGCITLAHGLVINQGDLWVLLCAFSTAGYILFASKASASGEAFSLTFLQSIFVFALAGGISQFSAGIVVPHHANVWIAILFCGIFASCLAFFLQLHYQQYVSASKAATIFTLEPVFATITAAIYLHERLTLRFYLGAILIFIAIFLAEKHSRRKVLPQG